jgi:1-acyl-sn-glycerol-3-phosphate acyltransferase
MRHYGHDMAERSQTLTFDSALAAEDTRGLRVALSPYLFRGMMVGMAAIAIGLHRTTGSRRLAWRFAKARARTLSRLLGVNVHLRGLEHVAGGGSFVYAPNHQSHLDILALLGYLPGRTRFAAKRELWRHPVVGGVLDTLGMVPIDRDHPEDAIERLRRAAADRSSFVIFPEGTRSRTGALLPFKKGAFVLAIGAQLPIVPVICRGTRRLMPRGSRLAVVPGDVEIVLEAPIPTTGLGYDDRDALAAQVRAAIERHHTGW